MDFLVGSDIAIEVKSVEMPGTRHIKVLTALADEGNFRHRLLVCLAPEPRISGGIEILPIKEFLARLWAGAYSM